MTLPISGPFWRTANVKNVRYLSSVGYRQTKPFNLVLTSNTINSWVSSLNGVYPTSMEVQGLPAQWVNSEIPFVTCTNRAYKRFSDLLRGPSSELLTLALEYEQTWKMIYNRLDQLVTLARAVRRFDLNTARSVIGESFHPGRRRRADRYVKERDQAGLWLEINYGWIPTVSDVLTSFKAMCNPGPSLRVKGSATISFVDRKVDERVTGHLFDSRLKEESFGKLSVRMGAVATVNNPNLYLLNTLGLLNPALSMYQVTYMSHVLNWFTDLEAVMSAWTDRLGVVLSQEYTTTFIRTDYMKSDYLYSGELIRDYTLKGGAIHFNRIASIRTPQIDVKWGIKSFPRAMNAMAQLIQLLPRDTKAPKR